MTTPPKALPLWPKYSELYPGSNYWALVRFALSDWPALRKVAAFLGLIGAYLALTRVTLPLLDPTGIQSAISASDSLKLVNLLFTGGALGHLSPFALGWFPFLFAGFSSHSGGSVRQGFTISFGRNFYLAVVLVSAGAALFAIGQGALKPTIWGFAAATTNWIIGSWLLVVLDRKLHSDYDIDVLAINAWIVAGTYGWAVTRGNFSIIDVSLLAGMLALFASFFWLISGVQTLEMKHIATEQPRSGRLILPMSNDRLRLVFLFFATVATLAITAICGVVGGFFGASALNPVGKTIADAILAFSCLVITCLVCARSRAAQFMLGPFQPDATAADLRARFWIMDHDRISIPLEQYLAGRAARSRRLHFLFFVGWAAFFLLVSVAGTVTGASFIPPLFGPVAFVFVLTFCAESLQALAQRIRAYLLRLGHREFWATPRQGATSLQFASEAALEDEILRILGPEGGELAKAFGTDGVQPNAVLLKLLKTLWLHARKPEDMARGFSAAVRALAWKIFLFGILTSLALWVVDVVVRWQIPAFAAKEDYKFGLITLWMGTMLSLATVELPGLITALKTSLRRRRSRISDSEEDHDLS